MKSNSTGDVAAQSSPSRVSSPSSSPVPSTRARSSVDAGTSPESSVANIKDLAQSSVDRKDEGPSTTPALPRTSNDSGVSSRASKEINPSVREDSGKQEVVVDGNQDAEAETKVPASKEGQPNAPDAPRDIPRITLDDIPDASKPTSVNGDWVTIEHLRADHKAAESRWQEEAHEYIERIDALQSKLKYLAKEAAESAKTAAASAAPKSIEKQLHEKDEKIALLFEEGHKLSKTELDQRTAIKKLRQQLAENNRLHDDTKRRTIKLENDLAQSEERAKRAEAAEIRANESSAAQAKAARDLSSVMDERNALNETVQEMKTQVARAVARAESAEEKAQSDALEQGKRRVTQLEEDLSGLRTERDVSEEDYRRQISNLKESAEQEKERARVLEVELKGEQAVLESKMESLRSRAEEASSGAAGDTQVKLLRQIETLQTQYVVASENWQTLEGSLLSRLGNVESERDDLARREGDMRRKIREVVGGSWSIEPCTSGEISD